jgi:acyl-CoA thioesterase I
MMTPIPLIICFGDSLTAGYQSPSSEPGESGDMPCETPYGIFLQDRLGSRASVRVNGICGEVTREMVRRFGTDVLQHEPAYVVILGGTNDLGWQTAPAEIMRNLLKMYEQAQAAGIQPVAVTVPSIRPVELEGAGEGGVEERTWLGVHIGRRQDLNRLIMEYCQGKQVPCVDLFAATTEPHTMRLASRYSNDGLHLTTEGYRRLADLLYENVFAPAFASD